MYILEAESVDLRQLRYFVVLADELHFRRAAQRLHITQAPLSLAIQALERELGSQLLSRTRRRVSLTESGVAFRADARAILERVERSRQTIRDLTDGICGQLRIGITPASSLLPFFSNLISAFRGARPQVRVVMRELHSVDQMICLQSREIDVGIARNPPKHTPPEVSFVKLMSDPLMLAMHRRHRLSDKPVVDIADLRDETFINYPRQSGTGIYEQVIRLCALRGFAPKVFQEVQEALTLLGLAAAGFGVALVPSGLSCITVPNILFKPLADADAVTEIHLGFRAGEANAIVDTFRGMAQAIAVTPRAASPDGKAASRARRAAHGRSEESGTRAD
jgi:DNA-binding transcriptional LysR family regulator